VVEIKQIAFNDYANELVNYTLKEYRTESVFIPTEESINAAMEEFALDDEKIRSKMGLGDGSNFTFYAGRPEDIFNVIGNCESYVSYCANEFNPLMGFPIIAKASRLKDGNQARDFILHTLKSYGSIASFKTRIYQNFEDYKFKMGVRTDNPDNRISLHATVGITLTRDWVPKDDVYEEMYSIFIREK
jgi:hypothetical protein